jgi:hypothetical protein
VAEPGSEVEWLLSGGARQAAAPAQPAAAADEYTEVGPPKA